MDNNNNGNLEQKIVETARGLFIKRGFERTSMSDIAQASGINRTTLHYYFRTKERMFRAVFGSIMEAVLPRIQLIFDEDIPMTEKFPRVIDIYIEIFRQNPSLPRFILEEVERDIKHLLDAGRDLHMDSYLSAIVGVIEKEQRRGNIREVPIPVIVMTFMSQLTFPFMARNLLTEFFFEDETSFDAFLGQWKENIIRQMTLLFSPGAA